MGRPSPVQLDLEPDLPDHEPLASVVEFYETAFKTEPEGVDWFQKNGVANPEPPRDSRRLHQLRGWGHGTTEQVLAGGA